MPIPHPPLFLIFLSLTLPSLQHFYHYLTTLPIPTLVLFFLPLQFPFPPCFFHHLPLPIFLLTIYLQRILKKGIRHELTTNINPLQPDLLQIYKPRNKMMTGFMSHTGYIKPLPLAGASPNLRLWQVLNPLGWETILGHTLQLYVDSLHLLSLYSIL